MIRYDWAPRSAVQSAQLPYAECVPGSEASDVEDLERQAERLLLRAEKLRKQAKRAAKIQEILDDPGIELVYFRMRIGDKSYVYGAVRFEDRWSTTGPLSPKSYPSEALARWMADGLEELWIPESYVQAI